MPRTAILRPTVPILLPGQRLSYILGVTSAPREPSQSRTATVRCSDWLMNDSSLKSIQIQGWIDRVRMGDESARDELIRCSCDRLDDLVLKMLGRYEQVRRWELADDVVQKVTLELYRALEPVTPENSREFLRLASMNIRRQLVALSDHFFGPEVQNTENTPGRRDLNGSNTGDTIAGQLIEQALDPARLAAWTELHRQIDGLADEDREVFELLWYQGLTQAEAADLLGVSRRTMIGRWQAARLRLFDALGGQLPRSD
jgi:RNA polymerase sigma factor (sigma-70 family)